MERMTLLQAAECDELFIRERKAILTNFPEHVLEVVERISENDEANLYRCTAHPDLDIDYVVAKVFRSRKIRSFSDSSCYFTERCMRERRKAGVKDDENPWMLKEWRTQTALHEARVGVAHPLAHAKNCMLMEFIGGAEAAPSLRQAVIAPENSKSLLVELIDQIELMFMNDCIHAALTPDCILLDKGKPKILDFSQAVDPRVAAEAYGALERDIDTICHFFNKFGIYIDGAPIASDLWTRYLNGLL